MSSCLVYLQFLLCCCMLNRLPLLPRRKEVTPLLHQNFAMLNKELLLAVVAIRTQPHPSFLGGEYQFLHGPASLFGAGGFVVVEGLTSLEKVVPANGE